MLWLLLIITLPTENTSARMRVWRTIKAVGCASLRDGVWLLPARDDTRMALESSAEDTRKSGGEARILETATTDPQTESFVALFDRSADYTLLLDELAQYDPLANDLATNRKLLRSFAKRLAVIIETDYFPTALQATASQRLLTAEADLSARATKNEPAFRQGEPEKLNTTDYQNKTWATRQDLWADRLASAWLIRRFIDPQAQFLWLMDTTDCPTDALGFDFDEARFTHVGPYVTFEALMLSFGLERDEALQRLGKLVHALDVGGSAPEAAGFLPLLQGLKRRVVDDDQLLREGGQLLDDLYYAFSTQEHAL